MIWPEVNFKKHKKELLWVTGWTWGQNKGLKSFRRFYMWTGKGMIANRRQKSWKTMEFSQNFVIKFLMI